MTVVYKQDVDDFLNRNGLKLTKVTSVNTLKDANVYDVTIKDDSIIVKHSFIANGIVTHNSTDPQYLEQILKAQGVKVPVEEIFGIRHPKTSQWVIKPKVRYYSESIAERFFDAVAKLERHLPDKIKIGDDYFYVYNHTKDNISTFKGNYDKSFYQKTGKIRVPAENSLPQALIIVDSYPAMNAEGQDEDETQKALALQARMFSTEIPRIKGRMKSKKVTIVGMNQLRLAPMVKYGSPEYEPGGSALKFNSDCRIKVSSRANPHGKGQIHEEEAFDGSGTDKYRYIHTKAIKNKLGTPYLEGMMRIWIEDSTGKARGFDVVHDCYEYLRMTGQIEGKRNKFKVLLKEWPNMKALGWNDFKTLILGNKSQQAEVYGRVGAQPLALRKYCQNQLAEGNGIDLFFENMHTKGAKLEESTYE